MPKPRKSSPASGSSRPTTTTQRWRSSVSVLPLLRARGGRSRSAKCSATHERTALQKPSNEKERKMTESIRSAKSATKKAAKKSAKSTTAIGKTTKGLTDEERAAMKERLQELKTARRGPRADKADGESAVLATIAAMPEPDRALGERLHAIIKASAPALAPRLWYGMPAYAKDGKIVCFFQSEQKFKTRYATLGFMHAANLDEGVMWPTAFALKELTAAEEARIAALVKKAAS